MSKIRRIRVTRLASLFCLSLAAGSVFFTASSAAASPLDGLTAQLEEAARRATSTVDQVAATVTTPPPVSSPPPVPPVADKAPPPVATATDRATAEVRKLPRAAAKLPLPPLPKAAAKPPELSGQPPVSDGNGGEGSPTGPVTRTIETASQAAATTVEAVGQTVESTSPSAVDRATGTAPTPPAPEVVPAGPQTAEDAASADEASASDAASAYVRGGFLPSPSNDGSVRAPLGKWAAYIWPAVALTRAVLPSVSKDWAKDALRLALDPADATARSGAAQGVAGAHAEHLGGPSSGSPLFSQLRSALTGGYGPELPLPAKVFFLTVVLGIFGLFITMLWDLGYLRRPRRRW
jgi:hypothetical protein